MKIYIISIQLNFWPENAWYYPSEWKGWYRSEWVEKLLLLRQRTTCPLTFWGSWCDKDDEYPSDAQNDTELPNVCPKTISHVTYFASSWQPQNTQTVYWLYGYMYCLKSFLIFVIEPLKTFTNEALTVSRFAKFSTILRG